LNTAQPGIVFIQPETEAMGCASTAWLSKVQRKSERDMAACSFKKLVQLLDKQLSLDDKLEVLNHLDSCKICRDAVYQISRDRDEGLFVHRPYNVEKNFA
jgi:hypothetical protein